MTTSTDAGGIDVAAKLIAAQRATKTLTDAVQIHKREDEAFRSSSPEVVPPELIDARRPVAGLFDSCMAAYDELIAVIPGWGPDPLVALRQKKPADPDVLGFKATTALELIERSISDPSWPHLAAEGHR